MKKLLENYYKPTPVKWRKLGDTILIIGSLISTTVLTEYEKARELFGVGDLRHFLLASIVLTVVGKVVTNFAKTEEPDEPKPTQ